MHSVPVGSGTSIYNTMNIPVPLIIMLNEALETTSKCL